MLHIEIHVDTIHVKNVKICSIWFVNLFLNYIQTESTCSYDGKEYTEGETFSSTDECNTCNCTGGLVICTEMTCRTLHLFIRLHTGVSLLNFLYVWHIRRLFFHRTWSEFNYVILKSCHMLHTNIYALTHAQTYPVNLSKCQILP